MLHGWTKGGFNSTVLSIQYCSTLLRSYRNADINSATFKDDQWSHRTGTIPSGLSLLGMATGAVQPLQLSFVYGRLLPLHELMQKKSVLVICVRASGITMVIADIRLFLPQFLVSIHYNTYCPRSYYMLGTACSPGYHYSNIIMDNFQSKISEI